MFDTVRDDVIAATHRRQQPVTYGSLAARKDFFFTGRARGYRPVAIGPVTT